MPDKSAYDQLIEYVLNRAKERELDRQITKLQSRTTPMEEYYKEGSNWDMDNPTYEDRVRQGQLAHEAGLSKQDLFTDDAGEVWPMDKGRSDRYGERRLNYDEAQARAERIRAAQEAPLSDEPEPREMQVDRKFEQAKALGQQTEALYQSGRRYTDEWLKREVPGAYATGQTYYTAPEAVAVGVSEQDFTTEEQKQIEAAQARRRFLELQDELSRR